MTRQTVTRSQTIKYTHVAKDAVVYELVPNYSCINVGKDGSLTPPGLSVNAYRRIGETREAIVTNATTSEFAIMLMTASGTPTYYATSTSVASALIVNSAPARFDLVRRSAINSNKVYAVADVLATVSIAVTHDGEDGKEGPQGPKGASGPFSPPPMVWEDYPDDYGFQAGGEGDTRKDAVLVRNDATGRYLSYFCRKNHTKSADKYPEPKSSYWGVADGGEWDLLATQLLLAANAYIKLLSSNGIRIYDTASNIVGEITGTTEGGNDHIIWVGNSGTATDLKPLWAVDGIGRHFIGGTEGQRIELRPDDKSIEVFEEGRDDPCLVIDGKRISNPLGYLGGDTGSVAVRATSGTSATASQVVADVTAVADKTISVVMGEVTLNATSYYPLLSSDSSAALNVMNNATITLRLVAVKSGGTTVEREVSAVFSSDTMPPVGAVRGMSYSKSKTTKNLRLSLAGLVGKYQVKAMWTVTAQSGASASGKWSGLSGIVPAAVTDYKALFGANFMLLSKSAENYMAVYEDASRGIVTEMRNGLYGLRLNDRGVQMCCCSDNYEPVPVTLFRGALYFFSGTGVQPIFGNAKYVHTFDAAYDGLSAADCTTGGCFKRLSASQIEVDLTLWKTKLGAELNWGNLFVHTSCTGNLMVSAGFDDAYTKLTLTVRNPTTGAAYTAGTIVQCEMVYYPAK